MRANTSFSSGQPRWRWASGWARPRSSRPRRALGHLETEGVVPRHAHAQVGHHQRIADHVMAQPVAGEPAQPVVQRGSGQVGSSIRVERQAQPFRRRPIKPARYGFVIVIVRRLGEHAPYQRIERHGHGAQGRDLDALRDHGIAHAVFGRHPARQTETQIDRAECQRRRQQSARARRHARGDRIQRRRQQRHRIDRVDDEHGRPAFRHRRQRPEQLGAIDGEGVQQRMCHQNQPERQEQPPAPIRSLPPIPTYQPGQQRRQAGQDEQRMGKPR